MNPENFENMPGSAALFDVYIEETLNKGLGWQGKGNYAILPDTVPSIPLGRLRYLPAAPRSVLCQTACPAEKQCNWGKALFNYGDNYVSTSDPSGVTTTCEFGCDCTPPLALHPRTNPQGPPAASASYTEKEALFRSG
jgi:hypothetical protein